MPVLLLVGLCVWVLIHETSGPPRIFDGKPDNAPTRAAVLLIFISPLFYLGSLILNIIDASFDRFRSLGPWVASICLWAVITLLSIRLFYDPNVHSSPMVGLAPAMITSAAALIPMSLLRRLIYSSSKAGTRIKRVNSFALDVSLPAAGDPLGQRKTEQAGRGDGDKPSN